MGVSSLMRILPGVVEDREPSRSRHLGRLQDDPLFNPSPSRRGLLSDTRTGLWGYRPQQIFDLLTSHNYMLYDVTDDGYLVPLQMTASFESNVVAIPTDRSFVDQNLFPPEDQNTQP